MRNLLKGFSIQDLSKTELFADSMGCSVALISELKNRLTNLSFQKLQKKSTDYFFGNINCRCCGQSYNDENVWIGLYFNNINFTPDYKLVLALWEGGDDYSLEQKLSKALISYKSQYFRPVEERWIFINLDNYLLMCDDNTFKQEIDRITSKVI